MFMPLPVLAGLTGVLGTSVELKLPAEEVSRRCTWKLRTRFSGEGPGYFSAPK